MRAPRPLTAAPVVLAILACANLLSYAERNVPFAVYDDLRAKLHLDDTQLGLLATAFMLSHALATLPAGWLADRVDRRRVLAVGLALWSAAGLVSAIATDFHAVLAARIVVGIGTAAVVPVANAMIGERYAGRHKAFALAIFNLGLFFGGAAGFGVGAWLGYPGAWIAVAAPGFAVALGCLLLVVPPEDRAPAAGAAVGPTVGARLRALVADTRAVLAVPTLRRVTSSTTVMAFAAGGYQTWLIDFLQQDKGMSEDAANSLFAGCLLAGLAGVVSGGHVGDWLRRPHRPWGRPAAIAIGMGMTVPFAIASILLPAGVPLTITSVGMMFFITWYHGPMAATVDDLAPPALGGSAQGVVLFITHLVGTAPAGLLVGILYQHAGPRPAMFVATGFVALAALLMTRAFRSFAPDLRARAP